MNAILLFQNKKQIAIFCAISLAIFCINLAIIYAQFYELKSHKFIQTQGVVSASYLKTKNAKKYRVFKVKTKFGNIYSTISKDKKISLNDEIKFKFLTAKISFKDYLKGSFYAPSFHRQIIQTSTNFRTNLSNIIRKNHKNEKMGEFYSALFLATPISKELREDVYFWGISHLVAISGYHASVIFALAFFTLMPIYRFFQRRYFPYRNAKFDITLSVFLFLCAYLWVLDFAASFFRSVLMGLLGFYFLCKNIKIISFQTWFLTAIMAICIFPAMLFSIGFYLSMIGVFYIYLYLWHFGAKFSSFSHTILLNFWTFLAMVLPVCYFFPMVSFQQLAVIPLTFIFSIFYPFILMAHLLNFGDILDNILLNFASFRLNFVVFNVSNIEFILLNLASLLAIKSKILAILLVSLGFLPFFALIKII